RPLRTWGRRPRGTHRQPGQPAEPRGRRLPQPAVVRTHRQGARDPGGRRARRGLHSRFTAGPVRVHGTPAALRARYGHRCHGLDEKVLAMTTQSRPKRASLADVAKLAGVSSQTVSRVVRGAGAVADDTRQRVLAAVQQLAYQPNLAARSLSQSRTGVIHVINATPLFHGHARTFLEIVGALGELGFQTSSSLVPFDEEISLSRLIPIGVDGVVILGG